MIIASSAQRANASLRPAAPHQSLPCVRGGGTSAHTGIGRVVTGSHKLAEDADEGDSGCRQPSPIISSHSTDRLQPLSLLRRQLPLHRGAFGVRAVERKSPTFSPECGSEKRSRDDTTFRNRSTGLPQLPSNTDCFVHPRSRRSRAAALVALFHRSSGTFSRQRENGGLEPPSPRPVGATPPPPLT